MKPYHLLLACVVLTLVIAFFDTIVKVLFAIWITFIFISTTGMMIFVIWVIYRVYKMLNSS